MAWFRRRLNVVPSKVHKVRRALLPTASGPARAVRSVPATATGGRDAMTAELTRIAAREDIRVRRDDGIGRVWLRRRGDHLPTAEWYSTAAPPAPTTKMAPASPPPGAPRSPVRPRRGTPRRRRRSTRASGANGHDPMLECRAQNDPL
jgi:hypothetical protein